MVNECTKDCMPVDIIAVSLLLTFEVNLLGLHLCLDVHWDLIELVLKVFNLASHILNCVSRRFLIQVLVLLCNDKVDFLRLTIQFLPANVDVVLPVRLKSHLARALILDWAFLYSSLSGCECDLVLIDTRNCVTNVDIDADARGLDSEALRLTRWQDHLQCVRRGWEAQEDCCEGRDNFHVSVVDLIILIFFSILI